MLRSMIAAMAAHGFFDPVGERIVIEKSPFDYRKMPSYPKTRPAFKSPAKPKLAKLWRERKGFHAFAEPETK